MNKKTQKTLNKNTVNNDNRLKTLLSHKCFVIQLLSSVPNMYQLDNLTEDDLVECSKEFIMPMGNSRYSDVLYRTTNSDEMFLLIEAQSYQDYSMMWRIQEYICGIHEKYFNEHYTTTTGNSGSQIYARSFKHFNLPDVIPIVYYTGSEPWRIPTSCKFENNKFEVVRKSICSESKYIIIDVHSYSSDELSKLPLLLKMIFKLERIASSNNKLNIEAIKKYKEEYQESLNQLSNEEVNILNETIDLIGKRHNVNLLNTFNIKEGVENMSPIDEMFENAKQEYLKEFKKNAAKELEDAKKIAEKESLRESRSNVLILLTKKFNIIPDDVINKINSLSKEKCNEIILNILDIKSLEELREKL